MPLVVVGGRQGWWVLSDDDQATYGLVLPFDSDDPEFTRGFEAGIIWERTEEGPYSGLIHAENAEMVMRIAEARGMSFAAQDAGDDEWLNVVIR